MPDGTGDEGQGPSLNQLKQLSLDLGFIRDKLSLGGNIKDLVMRGQDLSYVLHLGAVTSAKSAPIYAVRDMALKLLAGADGAAPTMGSIDSVNTSADALENLYEDVNLIFNKCLVERLALIWRPSGSDVILHLRGITTTNSTPRNAFKAMAEKIRLGLV